MLAFSLPPVDPLSQSTVETRPKAVAAWLGRLPYASPADAAQQLLAALYALNRHPLGADDRHALLSLYRPVIVRVAAVLLSVPSLTAKLNVRVAVSGVTAVSV